MRSGTLGARRRVPVWRHCRSWIALLRLGAQGQRGDRVAGQFFRRSGDCCLDALLPIEVRHGRSDGGLVVAHRVLGAIQLTHARLTAPELPLGRISGDQIFVLTLRPLVVLLLFPHANEVKPGCGRKIAAAGIAKVFEILPGRVRLPRFQMQSAKVLPWSRGRRVRRSCASTPGLATCRSGCAARWVCNTAAASSICPFSMSSVARC
jgi:hypothetical protein